MSLPQLRPRVATRSLVVTALAVSLIACGGGSQDSTATRASTSPAPPIDSYAAMSVPEPEPVRWPGRASFVMADHVPDDAVAYFEIRSIRELEEAILRVQTIVGIDTDNANIALATDPLSSAGIDPTRVDHNAAIAVAYVPTEHHPAPVPVMIVPAQDTTSFVESDASLMARGMRSRSVGAGAGYYVVEHELVPGSLSRGACPLTGDLPPGLIQGRFASHAFAPLLAGPLDRFAEYLNEAYRLSRPRTSASNLYEFDAAEFLDALADIDVVGLGIELDGDEADVRVRVARHDGIVASEDAVEMVGDTFEDLARFVDTSDPLSMLIAIDPDTAVARMKQQWTQFVAEGGPEADLLEFALSGIDPTTVELLEEFCHEIESGFHAGGAMSVHLEPAKAHVALYLSAKNPLRARETISSLLAQIEIDTWGFEMALPLRTSVDGAFVEDYSVRFDSRRLDLDQRANLRSTFKTFLGDSTLHVKVATSGRHVLIVVGGDTAAVRTRLSEFATRDEVDPHVAVAVEALEGADSAMLVHTDVVEFLGQIAAIGAVAAGRSVADTAREIAREVGDGEAPFAMWSGTIGDEEVFGTTFDLGAISTAIDAFKGSGL